METKICNKCSKEKTIDKYFKSNKGYTRHACKQCMAEYQVSYQKVYREIHREEMSKKNIAYKRNKRIETKEKRVKTNGICCIKMCNESSIEHVKYSIYCKSHLFDKLNP